MTTQSHQATNGRLGCNAHVATACLNGVGGLCEQVPGATPTDGSVLANDAATVGGAGVLAGVPIAVHSLDHRIATAGARSDVCFQVRSSRCCGSCKVEAPSGTTPVASMHSPSHLTLQPMVCVCQATNELHHGVQDFMLSLPVLSALQNADLRPRHWRDLSRVVGGPFMAAALACFKAVNKSIADAAAKAAESREATKTEDAGGKSAGGGGAAAVLGVLKRATDGPARDSRGRRRSRTQFRADRSKLNVRGVPSHVVVCSGSCMV